MDLLVSDLWPVESTFGKIADGAGFQILAGCVVHRAFEAEPDLIEVVAMTRRIVVARRSYDAQFEVVGRAGRALKQSFEVDSARAMPRNFAPFNVGSVHCLHSCGVARADAPRQGLRLTRGWMVDLQDGAACRDRIEDALGYASGFYGG